MRRTKEEEERRNGNVRPDPHSAIPCAGGAVPGSASQSHDQAGTHLEEVHGVAAQARGHRGDAAHEGTAQGPHQRLALGGCCGINA